MTKSESQTVSKSRTSAIAKAASDRFAMVGGGYLAGRYIRNSTIQGQPAALILGAVGLLSFRRASRGLAKGIGRTVAAGAVGAGCYGAGKMGEEHGEAAGNDGNLFSWGTNTGVNLD